VTDVQQVSRQYLKDESGAEPREADEAKLAAAVAAGLRAAPGIVVEESSDTAPETAPRRGSRTVAG
jgi:hypothetical protein